MYIYDTYYEDPKTRKMWWDYMVQLHQRCYSDITVECSKNVMDDLGIDYEKAKNYIMKTFTYDGVKPTAKNSLTNFLASAINSTDTFNNLMDEEMKYYKEYGTSLFPAIVINN